MSECVCVPLREEEEEAKSITNLVVYILVEDLNGMVSGYISMHIYILPFHSNTVCYYVLNILTGSQYV